MSDSLITSASLIHNNGFTAATPATTSPSRSPPYRRPTKPNTTTAPTPNAAIVKRWPNTNAGC
ncbi:MAG: hypothetical protein M9952_14960 [Microthrixaceae bacterium]|nr:hypothetical protein [Microthrixaceae bacterium]